MPIHPQSTHGRGTHCSKRSPDRHASDRRRHVLVPDRGRREGRPGRISTGSHAHSGGQWRAVRRRLSARRCPRHVLAARPDRGRSGLALADSPASPMTPASRAIHPQRVVAARAARALVPASTSRDSQAREFALSLPVTLLRRWYRAPCVFYIRGRGVWTAPEPCSVDPLSTLRRPSPAGVSASPVTCVSPTGDSPS